VDDSVLVPGERDEVDAVFLAVQCFVRAGKMQLRSEIFCIAVRNTENSRGLLRVVQLDAFIFGTGDDVLSTGSDVHVVDPVIIIRKGFCHFEGFHQLLSKCNHSLRFQIWQLIRGEELKQKFETKTNFLKKMSSFIRQQVIPLSTLLPSKMEV
jgi:hypothetical protein